MEARVKNKAEVPIVKGNFLRVERLLKVQGNMIIFMLVSLEIEKLITTRMNRISVYFFYMI